MSQFRLISAISRGLWFIEPSLIGGYAPTIKQILSREGAETNDNQLKYKQNPTMERHPSSIQDDLDYENYWRSKELQYYAIHPETGASYLLFDDAPEGSVAVIPIEDVIMRHDYCGAPGLETLEQVISKAARHSNICAIILKAHTPGGSVDYLKEFGNSLLSSKKFIMTFSSGYNCSAGIYLTSCTRYHIAENALTMLGSIGTMMTLVDYSKMYEAAGIKVHEIYATESPEKNDDTKEALKGNYGPIRAKLLDPHRNDFVETVKSGRGDRLNDTGHLFKGDTFLAEACLPESGNGLVDEINSFAYAVQFAADQGRSGKDFAITQASNHSKNIMFGNKHPKLTALSGKKPEEVSEEDINAINAELKGLGVDAVSIVPASFQADAEKLIQDNASVQQTAADLATAKADLATAQKALKDEQAAHATTTTALDALKETTTADGKKKPEADKDPEIEESEKEISAADEKLAALKSEMGISK